MRNLTVLGLFSAGVSLATAPSISPGGIVNAASYMDGSASGTGLARGSIVSIFGDGLGPAVPVQALAYPLPTLLGGASVRVVQGAKALDAVVIFASTSQVNAILPSQTAEGPAQLIVSYNGSASQPAPITVVNSNFGIFSLAAGAGPGVVQNFNSPSDQPLNSLTNAAKPAQYITLWGTGLGAVANDAVAPSAGDLPSAIQVTIGGKPAQKLYGGRTPCCAGVDQIVVAVPPDAPETCYVPVQVRTGATVYSNIVTMSIRSGGGQCTDSSPFTPLLLSGGKSGWLQTLRADVQAQLGDGPPSTFTADLGLALFRKLGASGEHAFDMLYSMPAIGTCLTYAANLGLADASALTRLLGITSADGLDAGTVSIAGTKGAAALSKLDGLPGTYLGLLGGLNPLSGTPTPLFLDPGDFRFSGSGGKDAGAFQSSFTIPNPASWTNRDRISAVDRTQGVTLTWSGGNAASELAFIGGVSSGLGLGSTTNSAVGLFFCLAPMGAGTFSVPASALANMPASAGDLNSLAGLFLGTVPNGGHVATASIPGLDHAFVIPMSLSVKMLPYK